MTPGAILPDRRSGAMLLEVADCVGPTFQTQGPSVGQAAMVIRLAGCDPACPIRDVPYTRDRPPCDPTLPRCDPTRYSRRFSVDELANWALGSSAQLMVISGGEPLLQQAHLVPLVRCLACAGRWVEIETSGLCTPDPALVAATDLFVVSPRLAGWGSRPRPARRVDPAAMAAFVDSDRAVFTFAVRHSGELAEIAELEQRFALHPIWVMPAETAAGAEPAGLSWLAEAALPRGWHVSTRLQA